jgi:hypothetical protein
MAIRLAILLHFMALKMTAETTADYIMIIWLVEMTAEMTAPQPLIPEDGYLQSVFHTKLIKTVIKILLNELLNSDHIHHHHHHHHHYH